MANTSLFTSLWGKWISVTDTTKPMYVCPDVSGSMAWPVTGWRRGATSALSCIDVAALVAAAPVRKNPRAEVLPFLSSGSRVTPLTICYRQSVEAAAVRQRMPVELHGTRGFRVRVPAVLATGL